MQTAIAKILAESDSSCFDCVWKHARLQILEKLIKGNFTRLLILFLKEKSPSEIKERLSTLYGNFSSSMATVMNWFNEFLREYTSVFDEPLPGTPNTVTKEGIIAKNHDLILVEHWLKMHEMAKSIIISKDRVKTIFCDR